MMMYTGTINVGGQLLDLSSPCVMGILNATPDSFYAASRKEDDDAVAARTRQIVSEGGSIIDVGACSTRPGGTPVGEAEEMDRLCKALRVVRNTAPEAIVSVDTFRPDVARMAVEEFGVHIVNDVTPSEEMFRMVAQLHVPYVLTSSEATIGDMLKTFARQVARLRELGHSDIILDPGFGFGKQLMQNYTVMAVLEQLHVMNLPLLVGVSRKRMVWQLLDTTPEEALTGTIALNTIALMKGAAILRVHDVREAVETVRCFSKVRS